MPDLAGHFKADVTIQDLERESRVQSDSAAAESMQRAKEFLFAGFCKRRSV
ncbi:MAG: hypothetical protein ABSH32_26590 [Bryobacteraceae bacterium]